MVATTTTGDAFCCVGCRIAASFTGDKKGVAAFLEARLLFSAFIAMGMMEFTFVLYGDAVYETPDDPGTALIQGLGRWALAVFSLPVFLLLGVPLIRGAWLELKEGRIRMDGLIAIATIASFGLSFAHTWRGEGQVYYETATMVLVLVTLGRRLEAEAKTRGRDAAATLAELLPEKAERVKKDGSIETVSPDSIEKGDTIIVGPGALFPADVAVVDGKSEVMTAHLTGESRPIEISPGAEVCAGATNGTGRVTARVLHRAADGSLGRIRELLEAPLGSSRFIRWADRLSGWLVAVSILLAMFGYWRSARIGGIGDGIKTALSVLLVACPCALGLAAPLAFRALRSALAKRGILVGDPCAFEIAATTDTIFFDKTGTLTVAEGKLVPVGDSDHEAFMRMAALVKSSGHPLARAVPSVSMLPDDVLVSPGNGVAGKVGGRTYRAGSPRWMDDQGLSWRPRLTAERMKFAADGATMVAFADDAAVQGLAILEQKPRPEARGVVDDLKKLGMIAAVLSGDQPEAVKRVADLLEIDGAGGLLPGGKVARIEAAKEAGSQVAFVGDGMNDAPALRAADVGIVVAGGVAAAQSQAAVRILSDDLRALVRFFRGARKLRWCVFGNLFWSVAYNAVALGFAVMGKLHPVVASASMIVSSLVVTYRSWRLMEWGSADELQ